MSLLVTSSQRQAKHLSPRPRAPVGRQRPRAAGGLPAALERPALGGEPGLRVLVAEAQPQRRLGARDRARDLSLLGG